jgi:uncharacterized protein YndB with AHSA1/START domain
MWMNIGIVVVVIVVALGIAIATRPDAFIVKRSATIAAPPGVVFGYLNDFHLWPQWSPWEKLDPNMQRTHSGAPSGTGANYAWSGNSKAGEGSMTITESKPDERILLDLHFIRPFKSSNVTEFVLTPAAQGTQVTWTMSGKHNTATKAFSLVSDMDKLVGKDFEEGLANLKVLAEAEAGRGATG